MQLSYAIGVAKVHSLLSRCDELILEWIFYGGVDDSEDLPLNISAFIMDACDELILVKASWIQRFLPLNISPGTAEMIDDYSCVTNSFGKCLPLGIHVDSSVSAKLLNC